jgi:membrane-bound lytic murein transglycosylase F
LFGKTTKKRRFEILFYLCRLFIMQRNLHFMLKQRKRFLFFVVLPLLLILSIVAAQGLRSAEEIVIEEKEPVTDLADILERGVLRATTDFNSTNYFIYRGEPMGFHLELLKLFAAHLGVELEIYVSNNLDENLECLLEEQECDLIAMDMTVTRSRSRLVSFAEPHSQTRQVLVQRKPVNWYHMRSSDIEDGMVRSQLDLAQKTIHVQKNSAYVTRLHHLMEEIGDTIFVHEVDMEVEQLIEMVANGEIEYTVADEHLARVNQNYYASIDVRTPVSFYQNLSWAVRPGSEELLEVLNEWMAGFRGTNQYAGIYNKYFNNPRSVYRAKSQYHSLGGGHISVFDSYFRKYSEIVGWDWRLIASLAYQESRFQHDAVSWAGAFGVMQLMPSTAMIYNVDTASSVHENIAAGVRYLKWLDNFLEEYIEDEQERVKFVLAAYNVGIGHVLDSRRLAEKYGRDPNVWKDNVDYFVLNKSKPKYYQDPVVRYGYARGSEPFHYVYEILERYEHYKNAFSS